jgi:replicative DNA helicase
VLGLKRGISDVGRLARASQNRRAGNYSLDSLKESGALGYAADVVLCLTEAQEGCATPPACTVELTVAKNRRWNYCGRQPSTFYKLLEIERQ